EKLPTRGERAVADHRELRRYPGGTTRGPGAGARAVAPGAKPAGDRGAEEGRARDGPAVPRPRAGPVGRCVRERCAPEGGRGGLRAGCRRGGVSVLARAVPV